MVIRGWSDRDTRYSIEWPLVIQHKGDPDVNGRILDISMGGCQILSEKHFIPGTDVRLLLTVPDQISERVLLPNPMPIHAMVAWCKEHLESNHVGVEFKFLSPIIRHAFVEAINEFFNVKVKGWTP